MIKVDQWFSTDHNKSSQRPRSSWWVFDRLLQSLCDYWTIQLTQAKWSILAKEKYWLKTAFWHLQCIANQKKREHVVSYDCVSLYSQKFSCDHGMFLSWKILGTHIANEALHWMKTDMRINFKLLGAIWQSMTILGKNKIWLWLYALLFFFRKHLGSYRLRV